MAVEIRPTAQTRMTADKMKHFDATADLRRELVSATNEMTAAARKAARDTPSTRTKKGAKAEKGGSLRAAVASSVKRTIHIRSKGITVAILAVPKGGKSNLVRAMEGEIPWQHPTYGHDPKVTQPPTPFFYRTLEKFAPAVTVRVERAVSQFEKKL